jgi:DNA polymerase delta subunit 1
MNSKKRGGYSGGGAGSQTKRPRQDDDEDAPGTFEQYLATMEDDDMEAEDAPVGAEGQGPAQESTYDRWARPKLPELNPASDKLVFQQLELDHYIGDARPDMPGANVGPAPVMRVFGVTDEGNSICCHIHGFHPYIYVPAPAGFEPRHLPGFRKSLNAALVADIKNNYLNIVDAVLNVDMVEKSTIYGFQGNKKIPFIKVTLAVPKLVAASKRLLEKGDISIPEIGCSTIKAFEANIDFEIRFMADVNIVGCNWLELPPGAWTERNRSNKDW